MSAAVRRQYAPSSSTQTQTQTVPAQQHAPYPTPISSSGTAANLSRNASGVSMHRYAPYGAQPSKVAGDSWSIQHEGNRQVIVIEDTPPPTATTSAAHPPPPGLPQPKKQRYNNGVYAQQQSRGSYPAPPLPAHAQYQVNQMQLAPASYALPPPVPAGPSTSQRIAPPRTMQTTKRKYGEVVDPAAAVDQRSYAAKQPLQWDDKDGHYIIRPDDELGDTRRYKIIKLLGQGTFGKVVEAWDRDDRCTVAVKIIRAIQKYRDASKVEIKVLNLLRERDPHNLNKCIHLIDCFDFRNHICIVTKLLSQSVFDFLKDNNYLPFPMAHIQSFAKQLLQSVAFLHDLRLVHTDLKPENILLVNNEFTSIAHRPTKAAPAVKSKRVLKNSSIHLIDFGSATFEDEYHASVVSTRHYRAPEIILGMGWSFPCDVWSIGCILVEFYTGEALFQTHENLEHLAMMEIVFGRVPDTRWGKAAVRSKPEWFANSTTKVAYPTPTTTKQSKKYVKAMKPLEQITPARDVTMSRFLDLLSHLLKWDPAERYTVKQALRHPFFSLEIDDQELRAAGLR